MTDLQNTSSGPDAPSPAFRDEEGALDPRFLTLVEQALESADAAALGRLVIDLHEADQASLLEAIDPDQRPTLIELLGQIGRAHV